MYIIPDSYTGIRADQQDLRGHAYQILPDNAGGFMTVWVEERYPVDRVFYQRSDANGQLADVLSAGSQPGYRSPPLLARLSDGNIVAVHPSEFPTPDGFLIRIHDGDSGKVLHEELFAIGGNPTGFPIVLPDPNGGFAVVWEESSAFTGYSSHARWFGSDAEPQGDTIELSLNGQSMGDISMLIQQDGTLAAVFQSTFQRIAPDGTTLGQQVDLGALGKSIAELADGSLVVASTDAGQIEIQRLSATGELIASEILVTDGGDNFNPVVAALSGGGFVVAFSAVCTNGEDTVIASFARRYLADGTPDGDVLQLSGMEADADKTRLVALPENGFAALFLDYEHPMIANFVGDINAGVFRESDIIGDQHDDILTGSVLADTIHGMFGDDALQGLQGDDLLTGSLGDDLLDGDSGNDVLNGGDGADRLDGGDGNDVLIGGSGNDRMTGGSGADIFAFFVGDGTLVITDFEPGVDKFALSGVGAAFTVTDLLPFVSQEGGDVVIRAGTQEVRFESTLLSDLSADDVRLEIFGQRIFGTDLGGDDLHGLNGSDEIFGFAGDDTIFGGYGHDRLWGGGGDDVLDGWMQDDVLDGGAGNDTLWGYWGDDLLIGGDGDDSLIAEEGDDTLIGGKGRDWLEGGTGHDDLVGEAGADTFAFFVGDDTMTIWDFEPGVDVFALGNVGAAFTVADLLPFVSQDGSDVVIRAGTQEVRFEDTLLTDLSAGDVIFL